MNRVERLGGLALRIHSDATFLLSLLSQADEDVGEEIARALEADFQSLSATVDQAVALLFSSIEFPSLTLMLSGLNQYLRDCLAWAEKFTEGNIARSFRESPPSTGAKPISKWLSTIDLYRILCELRDAPADRRDALPNKETIAENRAAIRGKRPPTETQRQLVKAAVSALGGVYKYDAVRAWFATRPDIGKCPRKETTLEILRELKPVKRRDREPKSSGESKR